MKISTLVISLFLTLIMVPNTATSSYLSQTLNNKSYLSMKLKNTDMSQKVYASYAINNSNVSDFSNIRLQDILTMPNGNHIQYIKEWESYKEILRLKISSILGTPVHSNIPLNAETISEEDRGTYIRKKVSYTVDVNERVNAYLLIPKKLQKQNPAILALHQTTKDGKDEVVGLTHNDEFSYGVDLVNQGFVVLAPDALSAGERIYKGYDPYDSKPFYNKYPEWSMIGKAIWDNKKALDYLTSLKFVDIKNIMVFGHSEGGVDGLFLTAFDDRVSALATNCGMGTISGDPNPYKWSRLDTFIAIPKLRLYLDKGITPFDFHELVSLVAPRPFLSFSSTKDEVFANYYGANEIRKQAQQVYNLYNRGDNLNIMLFNGNHSLPDENKEIIYLWLKDNIR